MPWSRVIPEPIRLGGRATFHRCGDSTIPVREIWRPWPAVFLTLLLRRLHIPNRTVIAFVGDGGFTMLMGEMATCVRYKLPLKVFVIKNNSLGQIKWEQMVFLGNPEYECDLQPIDFAAVARGFGWQSFTINEASEAGQDHRCCACRTGAGIDRSSCRRERAADAGKHQTATSASLCGIDGQGHQRLAEDCLHHREGPNPGTRVGACPMPATHDPVRSAKISAYTIPTETPEADGTADWDSTTVVGRGIGCGRRDWTWASHMQAKPRPRSPSS